MTRPTHDSAMRRFLALQLTRPLGVLAVSLGVLLWQSDAFGAPSPGAGQVLFALGMLLVLFVPTILRRRWRSPQ